MAFIEIESVGDDTYRVVVSEGETSSSHLVTLGGSERLPGQAPSGRDLVEASFRFLLDREPKESIMSKFDLSVIRRFFPEYDERIQGYL